LCESRKKLEGFSYANRTLDPRFFFKAVLSVIPPSLAHRRATRGLVSRLLPSAPAPLIRLVPFSCERSSLVPLPCMREPNPRTGERKMKSEQIKEITDKAPQLDVVA
jgi:hypothetical protein